MSGCSPALLAYLQVYNFYNIDLKYHLRYHQYHLKNYGLPSEFGYKDFVPDFTAENFDATASLSLNWVNPPNLVVTDSSGNDVTLATFDKVEIYRQTGSYPAYEEGTLVYEGTNTNYTDTGLTLDTEYYYSAFAITVDDAESEVAQVTGTPKEQTMDLTYNVSNFELINNGDGSSVTINWTNPTEVDFVGVVIRRDTTSAPTTLEEGTIVADISDSSETLQDTSLTEDETYYYSIWAYNDNDQYSQTEISDNVLVQLGFEYGLEWNQTTDSYTRLDDAVGMSVTDAETDGYKTGSDFDTAFPYSDIQRCNVADNGTVNAYYGDPSYATDGSNGQVMVEIPKFYYKTELDETGDKLFKWWISDVNLTGYEVHPAFVRAGVEKDYIYIGAFEGEPDGSNILQSISGVSPSGDQTIGTFRTYAENRGAGWSQQDLLTTSAIQLLYLIEYANFDTQSQIGNGWVDQSSSAQTGQTTGNDSYGSVSSQTDVCSYRGIENFWGSTRQWVDGFIIKDDGYYYEDDITNFNDTGSNYTHVPQSLGSYGDGYQNDLEYLTNFEFGFVGNSTGGTDSNYIPDYLYEHDSGEVNIALLGGTWHHGLKAGAFSWHLTREASRSDSNLVARLLYLG